MTGAGGRRLDLKDGRGDRLCAMKATARAVSVPSSPTGRCGHRTRRPGPHSHAAPDGPGRREPTAPAAPDGPGGPRADRYGRPGTSACRTSLPPRHERVSHVPGRPVEALPGA
ncbi:hypothetical protein GCM10010317_012880 [Streptomyces mirabilis]|nr:hypothetical protein GCM10010317_012880 [Streptomyces mirabilis]